jgi:prepilin-type N-terminal cleavage/methylation domain-containing protein
MTRQTARRKRRSDGFTLLEITIALLIVGILAAMAVPIYGRMVNKARMSQAAIVLRHLHKTQTIYYGERNRYTDNPAFLDYDPVKYDYYRIIVTIDNTGQDFLGIAEGIGPMAGDRWTIDKDGAPTHILDNAYVKY